MMKTTSKSRRKFITDSAKSTIALSIGLSTAGAFITSCAHGKNILKTIPSTGFDQQPLPYKYDALENIIDAMTMQIHYSKHAAAYSKNVKDAAAAEGVDITKPLEDVLSKISKYTPKMRNNGGGHYNHEMFWQCMRPKQESNKPMGNLQLAITKALSSLPENRLMILSKMSLKKVDAPSKMFQLTQTISSSIFST